MAKIKKLPSAAIISGFKGTVDFYIHRGIPCARRWPRPPQGPRSLAVQATWPAWAYVTRMWGSVSQTVQDAYRATTQGTNLTGRDLFIKNYISAQYLDLSESPPIIEPPGTPHFIVTALVTGQFDNGVCFTAFTDIPCHLWLYWTRNPPLTHKVTRITRGLAVPWFTRFCFTAYTGLEQIQDGDTLVHTFQMADYPHGQIRWFALRGQVNGDWSPSVSPVFEHTMQRGSIFLNPDFTDWPDPDANPPYWSRFIVGAGVPKWKREERYYTSSPYAGGFSSRGFAAGCGWITSQPCEKYRNQYISVNMWGRGKANANNRLTVQVDGTGGWLRHSSLSLNYTWQLRSVSGYIPADAENLVVSCRCYSGAARTVSGTWDMLFLTIEPFPGL